MKKVYASFIPAENDPKPLPLGRFLPPIPAGMVRSWLQERVSPGDWLIDPLGSTPAIPLEAAQAGYRILVTSNNPVISFMLEVLALAPKRSDFLAALAELGSLRRGDERLEQYLQDMYQTICDSCGQQIQPQAYLWRREEKSPFARLYHCPHCADQGERKITSKDIERLNHIGIDALHRSRAIERVRLADTVEPAAEEAIQAYLPRQLDFLFTIINKIEGLTISKERRMLLTALVLSACDEGSALWSWPSARNRPKQLGVPPQFRENNLWLALEEAITTWAIQENAVPLTHWPQLPPETGGICLFPGRIKALGDLPETLKPKSAVAAIPRPNQAFWTLCAVWSGWIWGKEAALPLRKALERRRYDWNWHAAALYHTWNNLYQRTPARFPLFGILSESSPSFLSAVITSAEAASFHLETIAVLEDEEITQIHWRTQPFAKTQEYQGKAIESIYKEAITEELIERNQPASYSTLLAACLTSLSQKNLLPAQQPGIEPDFLNHVQQPFDRLLGEGVLVTRYRSQSQSLEGGSWWLRDAPPIASPPLSDQIEMEIIRLLQKKPSISLKEIQVALYPLFPGLKTPSTQYLHACLTSYGELLPGEGGVWQLHPSETALRRRSDIKEMTAILQALAKKLHFTCQGEETLEWLDVTGRISYRFYIFASSMIGRFVLQSGIEKDTRHILVMPGSRSNLLSYKLREDVRLSQVVQSGWHFLKFRHLRKINERETLTPAQFFDLLDQDPPLWEEPKQMAFF